MGRYMNHDHPMVKRRCYAKFGVGRFKTADLHKGHTHRQTDGLCPLYIRYASFFGFLMPFDRLKRPPEPSLDLLMLCRDNSVMLRNSFIDFMSFFPLCINS